MRPIRTALLSTTLLLLAGAAQAQKMAPGLWETTMSMKSAGGQMEDKMAQAQQQLAKMPPEQRKMVEQMMAQQGVGMGGSKPNVVRVCIGKEQAERMDMPQQEEGRCKRESFERSGNTIKFKVACTNPPSTGSGEYTLSGDKAYSGRMVVDSMAGGKPQRMEMQQQGKWISADCGALKPRTP